MASMRSLLTHPAIVGLLQAGALTSTQMEQQRTEDDKFRQGLAMKTFDYQQANLDRERTTAQEAQRDKREFGQQLYTGAVARGDYQAALVAIPGLSEAVQPTAMDYARLAAKQKLEEDAEKKANETRQVRDKALTEARRYTTQGTPMPADFQAAINHLSEVGRQYPEIADSLKESIEEYKLGMKDAEVRFKKDFTEKNREDIANGEIQAAILTGDRKIINIALNKTTGIATHSVWKDANEKANPPSPEQRAAEAQTKITISGETAAAETKGRQAAVGNGFSQGGEALPGGPTKYGTILRGGTPAGTPSGVADGGPPPLVDLFRREQVVSDSVAAATANGLIPGDNQQTTQQTQTPPRRIFGQNNELFTADARATIGPQTEATITQILRDNPSMTRAEAIAHLTNGKADLSR